MIHKELKISFFFLNTENKHTKLFLWIGYGSIIDKIMTLGKGFETESITKLSNFNFQ